MMSKINSVIPTYRTDFHRQSEQVAVAMIGANIKLRAKGFYCFHGSVKCLLFTALYVHF